MTTAFCKKCNERNTFNSNMPLPKKLYCFKCRSPMEQLLEIIPEQKELVYYETTLSILNRWIGRVTIKDHVLFTGVLSIMGGQLLMLKLFHSALLILFAAKFSLIVAATMGGMAVINIAYVRYKDFKQNGWSSWRK